MERSSTKSRVAILSALIGSIIVLIFVLWPDAESSDKTEESLSKKPTEITPPVRVENSKLTDLPFELKSDVPAKDEVIFTTAIPVPGNPLAVTLSDVPQFGKISIEKYSKKGNPTGKPLESGTKVEIPNPDIPGGKIQFEAP